MQLFVSESFGILGHVFDGKINMFIRTTRPTDLSSVGLRIGCLNPSITMGPPPPVYVISGGPLYMCVLHIITCYIGLPRRMSYILPSRELQCLEVRCPGGRHYSGWPLRTWLYHCKIWTIYFRSSSILVLAYSSY